MTPLARIADRVINVPLLVTPAKAQVILSVLAGRIGIAAPEASRFEGEEEPERNADGSVKRDIHGFAVPKPYRNAAGVGIVTITGSLVNRGAWIGASSGLTSYEGIQHQIKSAGADDSVRSVILDMSTPGGEAIGAFETAAAVRALAARKRVVAVVNGMAASAGYAIASGAHEIVTTPTGVSGSIGVVLLHFDYSRMLANEGIAPTLIFAGSHKIDGNPFEPLSEGVRSDVQAYVDAFYELFLTTVEEGRGDRLSAAAARATQARAPMGQAAVDMKLADRIGTFETVLAELQHSAAPRSTGRSTSMKGKTMDNTESAPAAETAGISKADLDKAVAEAVAKGLEDGRKAEAARLAGIEANLVPGLGLEALIAGHKADATMTPEKSAVAVLATLKTLKLDALKGLAKLDQAAAGVESTVSAMGGGAAGQQPATTPEGWAAEWRASEKLQAEYPTEGSYVATKRREAMRAA